MNYVAWLWRSVRGVRLNVAFRVAIGTLQVSLGLAMVWLSKRFIDDTIRNGSDDDVFFMVGLLVLTVVGNVVLRQVYYYLTSVATIRQSNALGSRCLVVCSPASSTVRRNFFRGT